MFTALVIYGIVILKFMKPKYIWLNRYKRFNKKYFKRRKYMKCPKCGSENLEVISDVKGKGASGLKLCLCGIFGLCGTGKTKTTHYWVCKNCGHKFKM